MSLSRNQYCDYFKQIISFCLGYYGHFLHTTGLNRPGPPFEMGLDPLETSMRKSGLVSHNIKNIKSINKSIPKGVTQQVLMSK